jgi:hypothetical protein
MYADRLKEAGIVQDAFRYAAEQLSLALLRKERNPMPRRSSRPGRPTGS